MTVREYLVGAVLFITFAAVSFAGHQGMTRAAQHNSWVDIESPLFGIFATTLLWVAGMALVGATYALVAATRLKLKMLQQPRPKADPPR